MMLQPILKIDLSAGNSIQYSIPIDWAQDFLGGASLAARLLYDDLAPGLDPLSPMAPLIFLNGPLSGTSGPAVGRSVICALSPATHMWGESNIGGKWGAELRMAGYAGLWITGRAPHPVYLFIKDGQIEIREAGHLWGEDTYETQRKIKDELGDQHASIAVIGPAGEALIPFALVLSDHGRVAGRTGMGAVMGSKNLKAIAVRGSGKVPVANDEKFIPWRSEANRALREGVESRVAREFGTASVADYYDYLGEMPKRYYQVQQFDHGNKISGPYITENLLTGVSACHACVIACGRIVDLGDGNKRKGPEYETLVGFGPNLWVDDPVFTARMGELCDRYGMDTISLSNTIGLALLLFEKGVISGSDTGGLRLEWGNQEVIERLVHQTALREGLGAVISKGARSLGETFGAFEEAVQVNGLEAAFHDPRGSSGMALVYATSPRGACHNQSDYFLVDIGQAESSLGLKYYHRQAGAEKATSVAIHQNWRTLANSLVICFFANIPPETVLNLINSACGLEWDLEEMLLCGERGWNLKRVINNRLGINNTHDRLPNAFLKPYKDQGESMDYVPEFQAMLEAYYQFRQWDPATGIPRRDKLKQLRLGWTIKDLGIAAE